tara:strand:+ start:1158 stop:1931 length:774 start_codon:yes stop_codon:yes gene_type:complete
MLKGHVTICKIYRDGTQETVVDNHNLITTGLGSSFLDIQTQQGSTFPSDYAPHYFQLGTSAVNYTPAAIESSSTFYQLSAPLEWSSYGLDTELEIVKKYRGFYASALDGDADIIAPTELYLTSGTLSAIQFSGADQYFSKVVEGRVTKFFMDSFESEIILDENSANGLSITEVGLFAKNPKGFKEDSPVLMAYRSFAPLAKTSEFSLVIHWSIGFLGLSTNVDDHYTGYDSPQTNRPTGIPVGAATGNSNNNLGRGY